MTYETDKHRRDMELGREEILAAMASMGWCDAYDTCRRCGGHFLFRGKNWGVLNPEICTMCEEAEQP